MDSNTHSAQVSGGRLADQGDWPLDGQPEGPPDRQPDGAPDGPPHGWPDRPPDGLADGLGDELADLTVAIDALAARNLDGLSEPARAQRLPVLRRLLDRLEGHWLKELAGVDAVGAAEADQDRPARSTAAWLRNQLHLSAGAADSAVRTARALFRGPLTGTAQALLDGELSVAHAKVLADGTHHLPDQVTADAEPVLLATARRVDPPRLRQAVGHLCEVADPDAADRAAARRYARRGVWVSPTWQGMVALNGLLEAEAGSTLRAALEPLARPATADDTRSGPQRNADALTELARRALVGGRLPRAGGVRPQLLVMVDHDSLLGRAGGLGGDLGWAGPLNREACRRLACDGAVTRVMIARKPASDAPAEDEFTDDPDRPVGLQARLQQAMAWLPPVLGGAPRQPLEVGRATRVIHPAQRAALAVRDRGCVFPGCDRPLAWCDAHHLWHWIDGGPTDLGNLALVCREHHRAVHEGGWQLTRGPDGRFTLTPSERRPRDAA